MATLEEKFQKKQVRRSVITAVVSFTLVLFIIGIQGLLLIHAGKLSEFVKENVCVTALLVKNSDMNEVTALQKQLDLLPSVKQTKYVSEEESATELQSDLGSDFVKFLGYNPLSASIEIHLYSNYSNNDSLAIFETYLRENKLVNDVYYQKTLIQAINNNVKRISYILMAISLILLLIAIALINNTIRLSVYSKRLLIRSMQLVGATRGFIRKPFIRQSIGQGLIAVVAAIIFNCIILYYGIKFLPEIVSITAIDYFLFLFGFMIFFAVVITCLASYFAVNKYLKMNKDLIHY
ncbi:cell division protein FtsX [Bacteroidia bacterium]|nr:cell division protein FtsX [Bacteroidia bacterium]